MVDIPAHFEMGKFTAYAGDTNEKDTNRLGLAVSGTYEWQAIVMAAHFIASHFPNPAFAITDKKGEAIRG